MAAGDGKPAETRIKLLTRREFEVLALLAQGQSGLEIAGTLNLAVSSVKWHLQQIYGKLGVNRRHQALLRAAELGLLEAPPFVPPPGVSSIATPSASAPTTFQAILQGQPLPSAAGELGDPFAVVHAPPVHNLPLQATRFFGRETEIARLKTYLAEHRLVTVTGPGGVGKTRLLLETAAQILEDFPDGVWFVELAALTDPARVPQHVASCLQLRDEPGRSAADSLAAHLRHRRALLLLDNCEHLVDACAGLAAALLSVCLRLRLLTSSREPLGLPGEVIFTIPSLPFPKSRKSLPPAKLDEYASVQLFVDRARLVRADYQVAEHNAADIARICQRLDGIPLAIEMAASRLNVLSAAELAARLEDAFSVLARGSRTALPRHKTLRATIDWSYALLNDRERLLLQRLSVFAGGCTLEAAEAICAGDGLEASGLLNVLAELVSKGMVMADRQPAHSTRYRLLDTVRQYSREKLEQAGDFARRRTRHLAYYLGLAETGMREILALHVHTWAPKIVAENENWYPALEWAFGDHNPSLDAEAGPRLVYALATMLELPSQEERRWWCNFALAWCERHPQVSTHFFAALLGMTSQANAAVDWPAGVAGLQRAVALSRQLGPAGAAVLMENLDRLGGVLAGQADLAPAVAAYAEGEALLNQLGLATYSLGEFQMRQAGFANSQANLANQQSRYLDAKQHAARSIRLQQENPQNWGGMGGHQAAGEACLVLGEYDESREHFREALRFAVSVEAWDRQASLKCSLGMVDLRQSDLQRAGQYCRECLQEALALAETSIVARGLGLAAAIAAQQVRLSLAAGLAGAAQARTASTGRPLADATYLDTLLPNWRDKPEHQAILQAFEAGQAQSAEQAVAIALKELAWR